MPKLTVVIEKASNLPALDRNGKSDPYCKVQLMSQPTLKFKTKVLYKTLDPVWDDSFEFDFQSDSPQSESLLFRLFDEDKFSRDDKMDSFEFSLAFLQKGVTTKKVFKVAGNKGLVGQVFVQFTAHDFGKEVRTDQERLESASKRVNLKRAFAAFNVNSTGNLVKDYKELRDKMHQWRLKDFTMENVASLTFHCYDRGNTGSLTPADVAKIADHMFAFVNPANLRVANTKRQLQKWEERHNTNKEDENYSKDEFLSLVQEILKENQFVNKDPITKIKERNDIAQFKEQATAWVQVVGFEKNSSTPEFFDINTNAVDNALKPFNLPTLVCSQPRPSFQSNLSTTFFDYYHLTHIEDVDPSDNINNWRMSVSDLKNFLGLTDNKLKNIQPKELYDSYNLSEFKTEFMKLSEMEFETASI